MLKNKIFLYEINLILFIQFQNIQNTNSSLNLAYKAIFSETKLKLTTMNITDYIGFTGVSMILIAYFLNLTSIISKKNISYLLLNFIGAGIACYASVLLKYVPFIILEGIWTAVSFIALVNLYSKSRKPV